MRYWPHLVLGACIVGLVAYIVATIPREQPAILMTRATKGKLRALDVSDLHWHYPANVHAVDASTLAALARSEWTRELFDTIEEPPARTLARTRLLANVRKATDAADRLLADKTLISLSGDDTRPFLKVVDLSKYYCFELRYDLLRHDYPAAEERYAKLMHAVRVACRPVKPTYMAEMAGSLSLAFAADTILMNPEPIPAPSLRRFYELTEPDLFDDLFADSYRCDYTEFLKQLSTASIGRLESTQCFGRIYTRPIVGQLDVGQTLLMERDVAREAIANAALPWRRQSWPVAERIARERAVLPSVLIGYPPPRKLTPELADAMREIPNGVGLLLISDARLTMKLHYETLGALAWARQELAFRLFVATHNRLPRDLGELSAFVPTPLPLDVYSGEPFRYDASRKCFWSVGENGRDDGGVYLRDKTKDDHVVDVAPRPQRAKNVAAKGGTRSPSPKPVP